MQQKGVPTTGEIGPLDMGPEPWDYYDRLAELGDIVWDESRGNWLITSYELTKQVALADHELFESPRIAMWPEAPIPGMTKEQWIEFLGPRPSVISQRSGAAYDAHHRWWFRTFSPKVLAHWGDTLIEPIANSRIDRYIGKGEFNLGDDYAEFISTQVMLSLFGVPWKDDELMERAFETAQRRIKVFDGIVAQGGRMSPAEAESVVDITRELFEMLLPFVRERRGGTGDDFISMVWKDADELFGDAYDEYDVLSTASAAFFGGSSTTASGVANAMYMLLRDDELMRRVRTGGDEALYHLIEEMLRLYSPAEYIIRRALTDTELAGVQIKKDDMLVMVTSASSRDPERYGGCPHEVDLERSAPRDHFGFYMGPRTCPGQSLARFQLQRILKVTLDRLPHDVHLHPDKPEPVYEGGNVRRFAPVHIRFTPQR